MAFPAIVSPFRRGVFQVRSYRMLWVATTISVFGSHITEVAMPLLAVNTLDATSLQAGVIRASSQLPSLLFGLLIGVWVDRLRKRPLLFWADVIRAALLMTIPVAALWDRLNVPLLCVVAFGVGALTLLYDIAESALVPHLIPRDRLVEGNAKMEVSYTGAQTGGPAIAGVLVGLFTAPFAIFVDALSYLGSAFFVRKIDAVEPPIAPSPPGSVRREIREGLAFTARHAVLRPILVTMAGVNFFGHMFLTVYVIYMKRDLGLSDLTVGLVFAAGGAGALIGALITEPLNRRFGVGPTMVAGQLFFGVTGLLIPLAVVVPEYALILVFSAEFLQYLGEMPFFLNAMTLVQSLSPDNLRGRVVSTRKFVTWGVQPFGSIAGGILGGLITVPLTLVVGEIGILAAAIYLLFNPIRRLRTIPAYEEARS